MKLSSVPTRDAYDAVVVGSGLGGTIAAALMAKAGLRVLLAEQAEGLGGYAHAFHRGPYVIDPAIHTVGDEALFDALLRYLGVRDRCTFLRPPTLWTTQLPDVTVDAPLASAEEFVEAHVRVFPDRAGEIRRFYELCSTLHREMHDLPGAIGLEGLDRAQERFPTLVRYRRASLGDVLTEHMSDPRAKALCAIPCMILSTPPSRLPFQGFAQFVFSQLVDPTFYCQGGAERLVEAAAAALQRDGGDIVVKARVSRIIVEGDHAAGVVIGKDGVVRAPVVVSNAAVLQTFEELVGPEHLSEPFLRQLRRLTPSVSAFVVFGATRLPVERLGAGHQNLFSGWDLEREIDGGIAGELDGAFGCYVPTTVDRTLGPKGEHVFTLVNPRHYEVAGGWDAERPRLTERLLARVDERFPGFRDQIVFHETATPRAFERFTLNTRGAMYGWENTLPHQGSRRPGQRTPIPGLYLTGHWTRPGTGSLRASVSGIHTAQLVLKDAGLDLGAAAFAYARLPPAE